MMGDWSKTEIHNNRSRPRNRPISGLYKKTTSYQILPSSRLERLTSSLLVTRSTNWAKRDHRSLSVVTLSLLLPSLLWFFFGFNLWTSAFHWGQDVKGSWKMEPIIETAYMHHYSYNKTQKIQRNNNIRCNESIICRYISRKHHPCGIRTLRPETIILMIQIVCSSFCRLNLITLALEPGRLALTNFSFGARIPSVVLTQLLKLVETLDRASVSLGLIVDFSSFWVCSIKVILLETLHEHPLARESLASSQILLVTVQYPWKAARRLSQKELYLSKKQAS